VIFCPVGDGVVDIAAVLAALDRIGYRGFATIEQDRVPGSGAPLDDLRKSVAVIEKARASR
jgi:inosose dehydratase